MTDIRKNILKKISQGGSMMVEAMAMLALISLVTPTLYKKSAERTSELQDINTATHVRTLSKAVDNYVAANYQKLLETEELSGGETAHKEIEIGNAELLRYLPYGYSFDNLKNFGKPKIVLQKSADSITAFIQFPKETDIGEMRAARIASMVGSNGGYVAGSGDAKGVGGVWSLSKDQLSSSGFTGDKGSVMVASSEAINSATSGALENEKYLQRTQPDDPEEIWRNTMTADLYMGGVDGGDITDTSMHGIFGVDKMIVGGTKEHDHADKADGLVLADRSAWIEGVLEVVSDTKVATGDGKSFSAGKDGFYIDASGGSSVKLAKSGEKAAVVAADEVVKLVATGDQGLLEVSKDSGVQAKAIFTVENGKESFLTGKTVIGAYSMPTREAVLEGDFMKDIKLGVSGDVYVSKSLEAKQIGTKTGQIENLSAGKGTNHWWLTADSSGVMVEDGGNINRMFIDPDETRIVGHTGKTKLELGATNAVLQGDDDVEIYTSSTKKHPKQDDIRIYTTATDGVVSLQNGAITLDGKYGDTNNNDQTVTANNTISLDAADIALGEKGGLQTTDIYSASFNIHGQDTKGTNKNILSINASEAGGITTLDSKKIGMKSDSVTVKSHGFRVMQNETTQQNSLGVIQSLAPTATALFQVVPNKTNANSTEKYAEANVEIDDTKMQISYVSKTTDRKTGKKIMTPILEVDYSDNKGNPSSIDVNADGTRPHGSVYIRRGAIELEKYDATDTDFPEETIRTADTGTGYIEASRFVSNAVEKNGNSYDVATPKYAGDFDNTNYYNADYERPELQIDRYMVNPAYTSVMHDIKLTTRGGARLSDILPDFINKGIYVVTNTYADDVDIDTISPILSNNQVIACKTNGCSPNSPDVIEDIVEDGDGVTLKGNKRWASPFLGIVPAPQCPPGHAKLMTLTPAAFEMAQATSSINVLDTGDAVHPFVKKSVVTDGTEVKKRFTTDPTGGGINGLDPNVAIAEPEYKQLTVATGYKTGADGKETAQLSTETRYFLGYSDSDGTKYGPKPLYFQHSTRLRGMVQPQAFGVGGSCGSECGENFAGWSAIMGFVYPGNQYKAILKKLGAKNIQDDDYYWNVFPVQTKTIEAYATVYCYFDRTNIFNSGNDPKYVDQYDQLNNFRQGYVKTGGETRDNAPGVKDSDRPGYNTEYIERLNDPTLSYKDPW